MKKIRRVVAALLSILMLNTVLAPTLLSRIVYAKPAENLLDLIPDWAYEAGMPQVPGAPPDPLAGLLPTNPLAGIMPTLPSPATPTTPGVAGGAPGPQAPAQIRVPEPPKAPDCQCTPDAVNVGSGRLSLTQEDLRLQGVGPEVSLVRRYSSALATEDGPFGYGWNSNLDYRLRMYTYYHIAEYRGDGGNTTFTFVDGTNGAFVSSFDGDEHIHLDLAKGSYQADGATNWSLTREDADRYVVKRPDGTTYVYQGYLAPWRTNQDPSAGRLLEIIDRNQNKLFFTYDSSGHLTRVADDLGRFVELTWSGGHIATAKDHAGRTFTYAYTGSRLTGVTSEDHPALGYGYDDSNRLTSYAGGAAGTVTYAYDSQGQVIQAGGAGYTYTDTTTAYTDPAGKAWVYHLDNQDRIIKLVDPLGEETLTEYDANGRVKKVSSRDASREQEYDQVGRPVKVVVNGETISYTYNDIGLVTRKETAAGVTAYRYDTRGNLEGRQEPGLGEVTYTYDSRGRVLSESRPVGEAGAAVVATSYQYDDNLPHGQPVKVTNSLQQEEVRTYNQLGQVTNVTDPFGLTTTTSYDKVGRVTEVMNPGGGKATYRYDAGGRLTAYTAPAGGGVTYVYDSRGRAVQASFQAGLSLSYDYDEAGHVTAAKLIGSENPLAKWEYDAAGRLVQYTHGPQITTQYRYEGSLLKEVAGPGGSVTYERDNAGRVSAIAGPGHRRAELGYDGAGRVNSITSGGQTISATLNEQGKPLTVTGPKGTVRYTYDLSGRVIKVDYADGRSVAFVYDALDRLVRTESGPIQLTVTLAYSGRDVIQTDSLGRKTEMQLNWAGKPDWVINPAGAKSEFSYDGAGQLIRTLDAAGARMEYEYDAAGRVTRKVDHAGEVTTYKYDAFGRIECVVDRRNKATTYEYDLAANTLRITAPGLRSASYRYDQANRMVEAADPSGMTTTRTYTPEGQLASLTVSGAAARTGAFSNATWHWSYDQHGRLAAVTDSRGHTSTYVYDGQGQLDYTVDPLQQKTDYNYDAFGRLSEVVDLRKASVKYEYDAGGRLKQVTQPDNGTYEYGYDAANLVTKVVDPTGAITEISYTPLGQIQQVSRFLDGNTAARLTYSYDAVGHLESVTNTRGSVSRYEYDKLGRLTAVKHPLEQTFTYSYDSEGFLVATTDPLGRSTRISYDAGGRVQTMTAPDQAVTEYAYDGAGRLTGVQLDGGTTRYHYDGLGRLEAVVNPLGFMTTMEYDTMGNRTRLTDALGQPSTFEYDALNRLVSDTDRRGFRTQYQYSLADGVTTVTDREQNRYDYHFDLSDRLVKVVAPGDRVTQYAYDVAGRLVKETDAAGNTSQYTYDKLGRMTEVLQQESKSAGRPEAPFMLPEGYPTHSERKYSYTYDLAGNMLSSTDPAGLTMNVKYDDLGRQTERSWANPGGQVSVEKWSYFKDSALESFTTATGETARYAYDAAGRVRSETQSDGAVIEYGYNGRGLVTSQKVPDGIQRFEYDAAGNLTAMTDPRGTGYVTKYAYDALNRLTELTDPEKGKRLFRYDPDGYLTEMTDPRGKVWTFSHDGLGRRTGLTDPLGNKAAWSYTPSGQISSVEDPLHRTATYQYDALDRLVTEQLPGGIKRAYAYDWRSNLIGKQDGNGNVTLFAYDQADRLTQVLDPLGGVTSYKWDARGFLEEQTDAENHTTQYVRDPLGRLVQKTDAADEVTTYEYDRAGNLAKQLDPLGRVTSFTYNYRSQVTGINYNGETQESFEYDAVGNLTRMANENAVDTFEYDGLSRLVTARSVTLDKTTRFGYDAASNRTSVTDPEGRVTGYAYDDVGRLSSITLPDGEQTRFAWDPVNRLSRVERPNGVATDLNYSEAGRLERLAHTGSSGLIESYTYEYDLNGNQTRQVESDGAVTTWTYDKLNRLTAVTYPKAKIEQIRVQQSEAPKLYRPAKEGEKGEETDLPVDPITYVSPKLASLNVPKLAKGGGEGSSSQGNSSQGNSSQGNSSQGNSSQGNSSQGNSSQGNSSQGNSSQGNSSQGNSSQGNSGQGSSGQGNSGQGNGGQGNGGKDNVNADDKCKPQPDGKPATPSSSKSNGKSESAKVSDSKWVSYQERPDYLLQPTASASYQYDKVGNRVSMTTDQGTITYQYDSANRLLEAGNTRYSYDAAGNLTGKDNGSEVVTYTYNAANKMTGVTASDETYVTFSYDALGRKFQRTESAWVATGNPHGTPPGLTDQKGLGNNSDRTPPGENNQKPQDKDNGKDVNDNSCAEKDSEKVDAKGKGGKGENVQPHNKLKLREETTSFLYDGLGNTLIKEYKGQSAPKAEYYYANGQVLGRKMFGLKGTILPEREPGLANGGTYYYLTDGLGSVTHLTDHQGAVAAQYRYDAFGGLFAGNVGPYNSIGLTGKSYDPKAGLMDYAARWYDPGVGRFTQPDPFEGWLAEPLSQNPYPYVLNNPVNNTDPTGMTVCSGTTCWDDVETFDVVNTWYYNVRRVESVVLDTTGYWEIGAYYDIRHWDIIFIYKNGSRSIYQSGDEMNYKRGFEEFFSYGSGGGGNGGGGGGGGGGDPDPEPTPEEIRQESEQVLKKLGLAPETVPMYYAPGYGEHRQNSGQLFAPNLEQVERVVREVQLQNPSTMVASSFLESLSGYGRRAVEGLKDKLMDAAASIGDFALGLVGSVGDHLSNLTGNEMFEIAAYYTAQETGAFLEGERAGDALSGMALEFILVQAETGATVPNLAGAEWNFDGLKSYMDEQSQVFQNGRKMAGYLAGLAGAAEIVSGFGLIIGSIGTGVAATVATGGAAALGGGAIAWAGVAEGVGLIGVGLATIAKAENSVMRTMNKVGGTSGKNRTTRQNSKKLGDSLEAAGEQRPGTDYQAAHIAPSGLDRNGWGDRARAVLRSVGIDVNDARNGLWLHKDFHLGPGMHDENAIRYIARRLENAFASTTDPVGQLEAVEDALAGIRGALRRGIKPWE